MPIEHESTFRPKVIEDPKIGIEKNGTVVEFDPWKFMIAVETATGGTAGIADAIRRFTGYPTATEWEAAPPDNKPEMLSIHQSQELLAFVTGRLAALPAKKKLREAYAALYGTG